MYANVKTNDIRANEFSFTDEVNIKTKCNMFSYLIIFVSS